MPICCCFLEQETLLIMLQSTQLYIGDLVSTEEAAVTSMGTCLVFTGSTVLVSFSGIGVVVELQVPQPLSMKPGESSGQDLSAQGSSA